MDAPASTCYENVCLELRCFVDAGLVSTKSAEEPKLSHVIKQLRYTPGELKVTLTGILTEVSQADGKSKRKALKVSDSDQQSYILLENASLQTKLQTAQIGQTTTLTGLLSTYGKKHYCGFHRKGKSDRSRFF